MSLSRIAVLLALSACSSGTPDPDTAPFAGDPTRWEPYAGLGQVQAFVGAGAQLMRIEAYSVRSDGTMDLPASYHPYVSYRFRLATPPQSSVPLGAPGAPSDRIKVWVQDPGSMTVETQGLSQRQFVNLGMRRWPDTGLP